jgi:hypothetical protein
MNATRSVRAGVAAAALLFCAYGTQAQDSDQQSSSLADTARQNRSQHAAPPGQSSKAQQLVDEMQQEQEASENAPTGFKSYDAGDYRLFVPFPYTLEGRDNGGAVLLGSRLGVTNTEVLAGSPVPIPSGMSDAQLMGYVQQLASAHGQGAYCSPIKMGSRKAFRCAWSGIPNLLGHQVLGSMVFVVGNSGLIPVMCVNPDQVGSQLSPGHCPTYDQSGYHPCPRNYVTWDQAQKVNAANADRDRDQRTTWQSCDQIIYPSISLKEDIVVHPATLSEVKTAKPAGPVLQDATVAYGRQTTSVAELAQATRSAPRVKPQVTLDSSEGTSVAPAGFQTFALQYCQNPQQCSEASVVIPEKAEVVSRVNGQHIFKTALDGEYMLLYAGPSDVNAPNRGMTDPDYIRIRDLANPRGWSREKGDAVSTQELMIEGRYSMMTRFRYERDQQRWWIGERVLVNVGSIALMLACTAPEDHFADAEALCTTLVNSLRLP